MRAILSLLIASGLAALVGCNTERPPPLGIFELDGFVPRDAARDGNDLGLQTFDIIPIDVVTPDVAPADVPVQIGANCSSNDGCAFGARCLQGRCALDLCRTTDNPCGERRCDMRCVPTRDLCAGVPCGNRETCFFGRCVPGCFPAPCSGIECPAGQFCDDRTGGCAPIVPCSGACAEDYTCHVACPPRSSCDGVTCATGEICDNGMCVADPCAGVTCTGSSICVRGRCFDSCACDPPCNRSARDRCVSGQCQCTPTCTIGGTCGADDGCGGRCMGACASPAATCDPDTLTCVCMPRCVATAPCGSSDGCGGQCPSGCEVGFQCNVMTRTCDCIPYCPPVEEFANTACGANVPNLCPGGQSCGTGTRCPPGRTCSMAGVCEEPPPPEDAGPPDAAPPMPDASTCPTGRTACGESCFNLQTDVNHCGGCDTVCPAGSTCAAGMCVCPGSQTYCGTRCVNTQGDNGNCGACGNACAVDAACVAGVCSCVPSCVTDRRLVDCYTDVPNVCPGGPSCGLGLRCPLGSMCSAAERRCVCVPACPPGVACGVSDGCGGTCIGNCAAGQACARDPDNPLRYTCSAPACAGGCACDQVCRNNRCEAATCPNGQPPCSCVCCPLGQVCTAGSCQPIPP